MTNVGTDASFHTAPADENEAAGVPDPGEDLEAPLVQSQTHPPGAFFLPPPTTSLAPQPEIVVSEGTTPVGSTTPANPLPFPLHEPLVKPFAKLRLSDEGTPALNSPSLQASYVPSLTHQPPPFSALNVCQRPEDSDYEDSDPGSDHSWDGAVPVGKNDEPLIQLYLSSKNRQGDYRTAQEYYDCLHMLTHPDTDNSTVWQWLLLYTSNAMQYQIVDGTTESRPVSIVEVSAYPRWSSDLLSLGAALEKLRTVRSGLGKKSFILFPSQSL